LNLFEIYFKLGTMESLKYQIFLKILWNAHQDVGKRKDKWDGNGSGSFWRKKKEKGVCI